MARQSLLSVLLDLNADGFEKGLQKAQRSMRRTANDLKRSGANLTRNVTAPLALIGASSFKAASDFEQSMAKVKAVSGATSSEFKSLKDNALELGRSTRFSASEVSALQLEFSKLGFTAREITQVTRSTLDLAQATGSDLAQSAEVAGATLRAFGLDASETQRVTDVMAASFSSSALDMESFQDSMKYVAPVARKAGLSIEQTTAFLAQLANNGIKGSAAGTSLRRILSTVGATGGDVREKLANLSKEVITLGDAKDEVGRTAQSAFLVLKDGLSDVDSLTKSFEASEGAVGAMAAIMDDTAEGAMKRMQSAVEGAQITIGAALAPTILDIIKGIENLASKFSSLSKATQGFIVKASLAAAAIGPFKSSLGSLLGVIAKSQTATKLLSRSMVLLSNPMTGLIAAAGLLGYTLLNQAGAFDEVNRTQNKIAAVSEKAQRSYVQEQAKVESLAEEYRLFQDDMEKRKKIVEELKSISPSYFKDLDAEKTKYDDLKAAVGNYTAEIKAAAIQKAFGDELIDVTAEQLTLAEELREAELRLAKATEANALAQKKSGGSIKDGTSARLDTSVELSAAQAQVNALTAEANALEAERVAILGKVQRAEADLIATREGAGVTVDPTTGGQTDLTGGESAGTVTVTVKPVFNTEQDALGKVMDQLAADLNSAESALALGGDAAEHAKALAQAYGRAAQAAMEIGESGLALELQAQAEAGVELDKLAPILENLQQKMGIAKLQSEAFGQSFDLAGAQTSILRDTIQQMIELGIDPASEAVQRLIEKMNELNGQTRTTNDFYKQLGQTIGNELSSAFAQAESSGESFASSAKNIAKQVVAAALAESISRAIANAFETAKNAGPAAAIIGPILAATAAAGVKALFNRIPAFAEGGMVTMGPQLALIGDNPSGKEAVIPFEKMGRFLSMAGATQPQHVFVTGRISGGDILLTNERALDHRTRVRNF